MNLQHQAAGKKNRSRSQYFFSNLRKPDTEVDLAANQGWALKGKKGQQALYCLSGCIWVTQEGDIRDYLLQEGDAFLVTQPGLVLVRALTPARIGYSEDLICGSCKGRFKQTVFH